MTLTRDMLEAIKKCLDSYNLTQMQSMATAYREGNFAIANLLELSYLVCKQVLEE